MRKILIAFCVFSFGTTIMAQEVVATAGDFHSKTDGSVSFTLGEIGVDSYEKTNLTFMEGFQASGLEVIKTDVIEQIDYLINVYPNPVADYLNLKVEGANKRQISIRIVDMSGKVVMQKAVNSDETPVSFREMSSATYVLKVIDGKKEVKTITIIKK